MSIMRNQLVPKDLVRATTEEMFVSLAIRMSVWFCVMRSGSFVLIIISKVVVAGSNLYRVYPSFFSTPDICCMQLLLFNFYTLLFMFVLICNTRRANHLLQCLDFTLKPAKIAWKMLAVL